MFIEILDGKLSLVIDLVGTTTLAGLLLLLGYFVQKRVKFLSRFCIPAPVIGGLIFSILAWILWSVFGFSFILDTTLQTPFMIAFFACVGYGGSFLLLKSGGKFLGIFLILCWVLAICQNFIGVFLAKILGINPILGVMAGAVSLVGGHGNAAAFGPVAESLGAIGGTGVAIAAATYGLIAGSLLGGPVGNYLITKFRVPIKTSTMGAKDDQNLKINNDLEGVTPKGLIKHIGLIGVFMVIGGLITGGVVLMKIPNFALPGYVGAMFIAIIFRNINDKFKITSINSLDIDLIKEISLGFFLTMAIMTLKIWELASLAIPLFVILIVQTIFIILFVFFIAWPALRKDYDAAVMISGLIGGGLGVTATAVANMSAICEKYNETSLKAFLIVPLCCAVFVDIVAIPIILFFINAFA